MYSVSFVYQLAGTVVKRISSFLDSPFLLSAAERCYSIPFLVPASDSRIPLGS